MTTPRWLAPLTLLAIDGCSGVVGDYPDGTGTTDASADESSESGIACDGICDPDFAIGYINGINLYSRNVQLLADGLGTCVGDRCPGTLGNQLYGTEPVVPCSESEAANASPLGAAEYCRIAPLVATFGLDVGFTTPVERASFEELGGVFPSEEGAWLWHADVVAIEGPGTAYRGDFPYTVAGQPLVITAVENLSCIARLADEGVAWSSDTLDALCSATWNDGGTLRPRRMAASMQFAATAGRYAAGGSACEAGQGADACCNSCDYELSVAVAKYGVDGSGARRGPTDAITCDPQGDALQECRAFVPSVDRARETRVYRYAWDGAAVEWPLPLGDKLRETHPDDRPAGVEAIGPACEDDDTCADGLACIAGNCRMPWTVGCIANPLTTGSTGYCVDRRYDMYAAAECHLANADFEHGGAGDRLTSCDIDGDGEMTASECCDPALGGGESCDPPFQFGVAPIARYDRDPTLPAAALCTCDEESAADPACSDAVQTWCAAPLGAPAPELTASPAGAYAARVVEAKGGTRWNAELGVLELRIADLGGQPRASAEECAESRALIPHRNAADNWNPAYVPELLADHDLALCSGSTYRVVFANGDAIDHVRSEAGGTLDGRSEHVFETPQFRVIPGSQFPTDELHIGACDDHQLRFSNKYDLSATNVRKLELRDEAGTTIAGGPSCSATATPEEIAMGAVPCLTVDVSEQSAGFIGVSIDRDVHGEVLQVGTRYWMYVPGLADIAAMSDAEAYAAAFHDACGMPLVVGDTPEVLALWEASFEIDEPC
ncbi:MAG TPA: hypothetical protein VG755_15130 [Nannocystaceae bacterium]|nr:hypothetical protein [Nannocystaceae bacterium]